MYDPTVGQWLTEDPTEFDADDTNLYRYCENSPTNQTDPSGLEPQRSDWTFANLRKSAQNATQIAEIAIKMPGANTGGIQSLRATECTTVSRSSCQYHVKRGKSCHSADS